MKKHIVFWTHAYNAEHTIRRAIDSILGQTYGDFIYYCLDNGSKDNTGAIIREYAKSDARVIPLSVSENIRQGSTAAFLTNFLSHGEDGYMAWLDADDEYKPDFLERMLSFVCVNQLDIALCGTEYVNTNGTSRLDVPSKSLVFENTGFAEHLPDYYKYSTRMWGGLYSLKLLDKMDFPIEDKVRTHRGAPFFDVMCSMRAMRHSSRAGLLDASLHKYYFSPQQLSRTYTPNWFWWINHLQDQLRGFILSYGPISKRNENFLYIRYLIWLNYIIPRIQCADVPLNVRINDLLAIFTDRRVQELLSLNWEEIGIYSHKLEFLQEILDWVNMQAIKEVDQNLVNDLITSLPI